MKKPARKRPKTYAKITLQPGAILSNVRLEGCFVVMEEGVGSTVRDCFFRNQPGEVALEVRNKKKTRMRP